MAPPRPLRVLLSCTPELGRYPEDRSFADLAEDAVRRAGGQPLRSDGASGSRSTSLDADLVVAIIGFRYGPTTGDHAPMSMVEADLAEAERRGVPRLVVLLGEEVVGPSWLFVDPENGILQDLFRRSWAERADAVVTMPGELHRVVLDGVRARVGRPRSTKARLHRIPGPHDRFIGRQRLLDEMEVGRGIQVLTGPSGTGKSWLAAEYAHRKRDEYDLVWWVPCSTPDALSFMLAELAALLGVEPTDDVLSALGDRLRQTAVTALVVLDDLTDPKVFDLFEGTRCDVLVTARQDLPGTRRVLAVGPFERDESVALLLDETDWSNADAEEVASLFLNHPLSVATAARYARHAGLSAREYQDRLRAAITAQTGEKTAITVPARISAALRVVLDDVFMRDQKVYRLLATAAQFGPEPVPLALLGDDLGGSHDIAEVIRWLDWIAPVEVGGRLLTVHPLLAEEVRLRTQWAEESPEVWLARAMKLLVDAMPEDWSLPFTGDPTTLTLVMTHLYTVLQQVTDTAMSSRGGGLLIDGLFPLLEKFAKYEPAINSSDQAVTLLRGLQRLRGQDQRTRLQDEFQRLRALHGEDDPRTLDAAGDVISALRERGSSREALDLARAVLPAHERAFGPADARTLAALNTVAALLRDTEDLDEARSTQEEVLGRAVASLGEEHEETLTARANLASLLHELGELTSALELDEDVLRTAERLLGPSHPRTLAAKASVAADLLALDRAEEARALNEDVVERSRRVLGPDHPDTLVAAGNLADSLAALGEDEAALRLDQETHERYRRVLGPDHPDTLLSANNLAAGLRALGRFAEAAEIDRTTAARLRQVLGPDHPDALRSADNLALDLRLLEQAGGERGERS